MLDHGNDPGLASIAFRAGAHGSFKAAMLAALARQPALARLTSRADDDPTVALLDAWAAALDVLTFYGERIANEGYLRTATERRSVLELARAIGHELNPGVAASAHLAFTVSALAEPPPPVALPAGTRVQSVPVDEDPPQTFETVEALEARVEWNALHPRRDPVVPRFGMTELPLRGAAVRVAKGDLVLVIGDEGAADPASEEWDLRRVKDVIPVPPPTATADPAAGVTIAVLDRALGSFRRKPAGGGLPRPPDSGPLPDLPGGGVELPDLDLWLPAPYLRTNARVHVFRQRAALFGHNAPDWRSMSTDVRAAYGDDGTGSVVQWPRFNLAYTAALPASLSTVCLDAVYPGLAVDGWVILSSASRQRLHRTVAVEERALAEFTLTARVTQLRLDRDTVAADFPGTPREVAVLAQAELLELAPAPAGEPVGGTSVVVREAVPDLPPGRALALSGSDPATGEARSEVALLASAAAEGEGTRLTFSTALVHTYARETLVLQGNVALATHGQATSEVLGSGDASRPFQELPLRQKPLTFLAASNPTGAASTLVVRVNGVAWTEVPSLEGAGPDDRVYTTRAQEDGTVVVRFGDGRTGARPSTGRENVTASYRVGLGRAGGVAAGRLSLLLTRPLGLESVVNPLPAAGGADPEDLAEARDHAPLTVLTLDRVVSVRDFEDAAGAFAGIGKAQAALVWDGQRRVVHLTVAGVEGAAVEPGSALAVHLRAALDAARQTDQPLAIDTYRVAAFRVEARLTVDPAHLSEEVRARAAGALLEAFSFPRRGFGEPVTAAAVLAALQAVEGVVAVDLDALHLRAQPRSREPVLRASRAAFAGGALLAAELLTLAAEDVVLLEA